MLDDDPNFSSLTKQEQGSQSTAILAEGLSRFAETAMSQCQWREAIKRWQFMIQTLGAFAPPIAFSRCSMALCAVKEWEAAEKILTQGRDLHEKASILQREYAEQAMRRADWELAQARWSEMLMSGHSAVGAVVGLGFQTATNGLLKKQTFENFSPLDLNTHRALALNGIHGGATLFIIGHGRGLQALTSAQISEFESQITIGTSRTQFRLKSDYTLTLNREEALFAYSTNQLAQVIQIAENYEKESDDGILCLRSIGIPEIFSLPITLQAPRPSLQSDIDPLFASLGLAYVMAARRIVLVGFDSLDSDCYYEETSTRERMAGEFLRLSASEGWMSNVDLNASSTPAPVWQTLKSILVDSRDSKPSAPSNEALHIELLKNYFSHLSQRGVEVVCTSKKSVCVSAGAKFQPLAAVLAKLKNSENESSTIHDASMASINPV